MRVGESYRTPSGRREYWVEKLKLIDVYPHAKAEFAQLDAYAVMGMEKGKKVAMEVGGEAFCTPEAADRAALHLAFGMRSERTGLGKFHGMYAQASRFARNNARRMSIDVQPHSGPHQKLELLFAGDLFPEHEGMLDEIARRINNCDNPNARLDEGRMEAAVEDLARSIESNRVSAGAELRAALRRMYAAGKEVTAGNRRVHEREG